MNESINHKSAPLNRIVLLQLSPSTGAPSMHECTEKAPSINQSINQSVSQSVSQPHSRQCILLALLADGLRQRQANSVWLKVKLGCHTTAYTKGPRKCKLM